MTVAGSRLPAGNLHPAAGQHNARARAGKHRALAQTRVRPPAGLTQVSSKDCARRLRCCRSPAHVDTLSSSWVPFWLFVNLLTSRAAAHKTALAVSPAEGGTHHSGAGRLETQWGQQPKGQHTCITEPNKEESVAILGPLPGCLACVRRDSEVLGFLLVASQTAVPTAWNELEED